MVRARSGASCVPPALETCAPSRSLGGSGNGPCSGPSGLYFERIAGTLAGLAGFAAGVFAAPRMAAFFGVFPGGDFFAADFFLPRELVAPPAERAAAAGAVEVRVFRLFEREVEAPAAPAFGFERVAPADDAEGVFRFVRPEPAADRASFRDMILAHGRAFR
jgi:hypothetical protein